MRVHTQGEGLRVQRSTAGGNRWFGRWPEQTGGKELDGEAAWALDRAAKSHGWYKGKAPGTTGTVYAVYQSRVPK